VRAKIRRHRLWVALVAIISAVAIVGPTMAAQTYAPGDPYVLVINQEAGVHNIFFQDESGSHGNGGGGNHSYLVDSSKLGFRSTEDPTCTSLDDSKCAAATDFRWNAALPLCATASDINCLETFGSVNADGTQSAATFDSYFPSKAQNAFTGDPSRKLPTGASSSKFKLNNPDGSSTTYFVTAFLTGNYRRGDAATRVSGFNLEVLPVQVTPALNPGPCITNETNSGLRGGECGDSGFLKMFPTLGSALFWWGESGGQGADCGTGTTKLAAIAHLDKLCAKQVAFPSNSKYFVKVRLNATPTGWMHGRLTDPAISVNKVANGNEYSFTGSPVLVPSLYRDNFWKDIPANILAHYDPVTGNYDNSSCDGFTTGKFVSAEDFKNPLIRNFTEKPCASGAVGIAELNTWLPLFNNTATATPSIWNVRTISDQETQGANKCFSDPNQITGIVTTNSTEYSSGPPAFSKETGTLDYQVASPHFIQDGTTPFKGVYHLIMRSDVARCIYGFSKAPIKATVSVITSSGTPEVATVIVGEKDGWLYLSANNFEFSSPTIQVKLAQDAPVVVPAPVKPAVAKTITCIKGKTILKTTLKNCPKGYKVK
jgi:hypothetical protein